MKTKSLLKVEIAFVLVFWFSYSCTTKNKQTNQTELNTEATTKALALLDNNCLSCHNPQSYLKQRIAPPISEIKEQYWSEAITAEEFTQKIIHFVNNPTEENSIMHGAVRNFGLMPKISYNENDLKAISQYIYQTDFTSNEWISDWETYKKSNKAKASSTDESYGERGLKLAMATKTELGKNLLQAIQNYGEDGAVEFCNTRALPITDSMSKVLNANIKRVSDKPRNPLNQANESEIDIIKEFKDKLLNNEKPGYKVVENQDNVLAYYPIITNQMCLKCHGTKDKTLLLKTKQKIDELYPSDKAIGYGENEVRGVFVVEMQPQ